MNKCLFEIKFKFVGVNNEFMSIQAVYGNNVQKIVPDENDLAIIYQQEIELPCNLKFIFSGKDIKNDTIFDQDGNIIRDKHVYIEEILLDHFPVDNIFLKHGLKLEVENGQYWSNYVNRNGTMKIEFTRPNVFLQLYELQKLNK
jgi:hypothetical protein